MKALLAAAAVLSLAVGARAQPAGSVAAAARDFGLLGVWAQDCSKPAAKENVHPNYTATSEGGVHLADDLGPNIDLPTSELLELERLGPNRLSVLKLDSDGSRIKLEILRDGDRYRVMKSVEPALGEKGVYIKGGKFVDGGADSPWFNRCPAE